MQIKTWKDWLLMALLSFALIMMITGMFGACNPAKKAQRELEKAKKVLDGNYGEAAKFCADKFPPKIEYIKGDSVLVLDTLYVGGDVVFDTVKTKDTVFITKTLPAKVITKSVRIVDTIRDSNPAALIAANVRLNEKIGELAVCNAKADELKKNMEDWKKKAKTRNWLWLLVLVLVGWNFRKTIFKIIKPI